MRAVCGMIFFERGIPFAMIIEEHGALPCVLPGYE